MSVRGKRALRFLALAALLGVTGYVWSLANNDTAADQDVYYRLLTKYRHGEEIVDFDIVVGCGIRITANPGDSHSFDVLTRDPVYFVKATSDGGAVWQIVPDACRGQSTDNGRVPRDLLPGAIWFDRASDLTFGIAYVTEEAYENPASKLKFLGASIHHATREDWERFQPTNEENLGSPSFRSRPWPYPKDADELRANLWNKAKLRTWMPDAGLHCYGAARFQLADEQARATLRSFWPQNRPKFWSVPSQQFKEVTTALIPHDPGDHRGPLVSGGHFIDEHSFYRKHAILYGFPTRSRGGSFDTPSQLPSILFPKRADEGLPWLSERLALAETFYRDVEWKGGANQGYLYCYSMLSTRTPIGQAHFGPPNTRTFLTRVDGDLAQVDGANRGPDQPAMFFERDEYVYYMVDFWP